jgi:hypothetical protein
MDFQTPSWCCEYMVSLISKETSLILDPTPGEGNLVKALENKNLLDVAKRKP